MGNIERNNGSGFDLAVLTYENISEPTPSTVVAILEKEEKARLFLLSSSEANNPQSLINDKPVKQKSNRRRPKNRKRPTYHDTIARKGTEYKINNGNGDKKLGLYIETLHSIIDQFEVALKKWRRVFVLRFDLHMPFETSSNKPVTDFRKRLSQRLKREYGFKDIGYCWAREYHGKGKGQHYHWVLFLDGNLVRHSSRLREMVKQSWERPAGGYTVPTIKHPFYFADTEEIAQDAICRISYLAKTRGKGHRPPQTKDFQCSRLKL